MSPCLPVSLNFSFYNKKHHTEYNESRIFIYSFFSPFIMSYIFNMLWIKYIVKPHIYTQTLADSLIHIYIHLVRKFFFLYWKWKCYCNENCFRSNDSIKLLKDNVNRQDSTFQLLNCFVCIFMSKKLGNTKGKTNWTDIHVWME